MFGEEKKEESKKGLEKIKKLEKYIPVIGIIVVNLQLLLYVITTKKFGIGFIIFDVILNLVIIYQWKLDIRQKAKIEEQANYNTYLEERNKHLVELNDSVRCFKHDFYNIIQAIHGYIMLNNMEGLNKYFSKLLEECEYVKNLEILTSRNINDPAIYGVLLNKYKLAEKKNVTMNINVLTDFNSVGEKSYQLSRIVGILLDNAIEASLDCKEKVINVQLSQSVDDGKKKIVIENTYNDKDVDIINIFNKEFSTKKGNSGLGLWKVKNILKKETKMWLATTKDTKMFKQEIEISLM